MDFSILEPHVVDYTFFLEYKQLISKNFIDFKTKSQIRNFKKSKTEYSETHHIIPVSHGGTNDIQNLVVLQGKDHLYAHYLLYKAINDIKMTFAFNQMRRYIKKHGHNLSENELLNICEWYEEARIDISKSLSTSVSEKYKTVSEEERNRRREVSRQDSLGKQPVIIIETGVSTRIWCKDFDPLIHRSTSEGTTKSAECRQIMSIKGQIEYKGIPYHVPITKEIKYFHEGEQPDNFIKGNGTINTHTKGTVFYHNPETKEQIRCPKGQEPEGWISGRATFANPFSGTKIKTHIITREVKSLIDDIPLWVSHQSKGLYTFISDNKNIVTSSLTTVCDILNLDNTYLKSALLDPNKLITNHTSSNGLNKTHKGKHIKDVYSIKFYPKEELTMELCNELLIDRTWF